MFSQTENIKYTLDAVKAAADLVNAFRRERLANQVLMQIVRDGRPYYARVLLQ